MTDIYCLLCDEILETNKKGVLTDNKTGKAYPLITCEECDQAFTINNNELSIIPFRADMTPIKHECKICGNIEHFDQKVVFILADEYPRFSTYCIDCGLELLRNWLREKHPDKVNEITKENVQDFSQLHEMQIVNEMMGKQNKILLNQKNLETLEKVKPSKERKKTESGGLEDE